MLLGKWICQNEDPKSAVIVGLPFHPLKIFPHWGRMNFWLTVLTGISDPELVFGVWRSLVTCGDVSSVTFEIQGLNPPGQGDEEDARWICKNVSPFSMRIPNIWRLVVAARHFPKDGLASLQDHEKVGVTRVVWEDCSRPKCLTPHSRKYAWDFSSNKPTWKMKMKNRRMKRKMRETVKSAEWSVEEYQIIRTTKRMMTWRDSCKTPWANVTCDIEMSARKCEKMWRVRVFCSHTPLVAADCCQL